MYVNGMWRLSLTRIVCCPQPSFPAMRAVPFPHGEETYLLQERMTNVKTGNLISGIVSLSQPSPMGEGAVWWFTYRVAGLVYVNGRYFNPLLV